MSESLNDAALTPEILANDTYFDHNEDFEKSFSTKVAV
jgi:hypothetical protein